MLTVKELIFWAFSEVIASKTLPKDTDYVDGLKYLNRMMSSFLVDGIDVNYVVPSSIDESLSVHHGAILGMTKNLAYRLWPQYNINQVNPVLKREADRSLATMRYISFDNLGVSKFSGTLPVGSGNYESAYQDYFYTNEQKQDNYLALERSTKRDE